MEETGTVSLAQLWTRSSSGPGTIESALVKTHSLSVIFVALFRSWRMLERPGRFLDLHISAAARRTRDWGNPCIALRQVHEL